MKKLYLVLIAFLVFGSVNAQIINFPDANFKAKLISLGVDTNSDGFIQASEALARTNLDVSNSSISSLIGIESFTNLTNLYCFSNQLPSLDVSGLTSLKNLYCHANQLSSLNVSGLTNLEWLSCYSNQLTSINVSGLTNLQYLDFVDNQLTSLNVSGLTNLNHILCINNLLTSLDMSGLTNLQSLFCGNNQLITLFIKNGSIESSLNFYGNPNLQYICADEGQITAVQSKITQYGYTNCYVNSYCSFTPGGTFYTIQGNNHYDSNNNGCSPTDINYPNLKLTFTDGTNSGNLISNTTGAYHYDVQAGTQTITPTLENPTYFNISPTTATVTFPTTASPYIQDFCITANGIHNDLEVTLLPIGVARPGFDATYKIIYKNKGTGTQSGTVNFAFDDARLDFVSATPSVDVQTVNNLTFNFSTLAPLETREIVVTLNVNSPTETPAVNGGDILNYTATVTGATDETLTDNTASLAQTVVNSFDPNDKTCTEGATVSPSMVGKYVHYIIRFENDGTANAQNIVVKDMIDTTKFDISSLVPLSGSASYTTRITNTNQVEFIFQNINLPYTTGANTGYVAFKIKTKPTLVVGDTFSNTANIYFDYNAPIVTNTATTTIATLANPTFAFSDYFTLSPVPAKNVLNITAKQDSVLSSISIYNTLGQLMSVTSNPSTTIDVSNLATGSYFVKILSDKGSSSGKFIKE
ncbi:MAG: T9SS type A sorting domain-containing protein [Flavobacterium sp.]|nr:T9SS type A sorting domain-containing protein [Flavobacterium sp.]